MSSLEELDSGSAKANFKVLKQISPSEYIIGYDNTTLGLMSTDQILEENKSYRIIKPIKKGDKLWEKSTFEVQEIKGNITKRKLTPDEESKVKSKLRKINKEEELENTTEKKITFLEVENKFKADKNHCQYNFTHCRKEQRHKREALYL